VGLLRRLALFLGVPALALGGAIATTVPALAVSTGPLCQTFDHNYCIRVDSPIHLGEQVLEGSSPGRTIRWTGGGDGTIGKLIVEAASPDMALGVGTSGSFNVIMRDLDASGTDWIRHSSTGHLFESRKFPGNYLTGQDQIGSIVFICSRPCTSFNPYEQQWNGP
jgi:hypothetical protein